LGKKKPRTRPGLSWAGVSVVEGSILRDHCRAAKAVINTDTRDVVGDLRAEFGADRRSVSEQHCGSGGTAEVEIEILEGATVTT
jgi:hypothetical protein